RMWVSSWSHPGRPAAGSVGSLGPAGLSGRVGPVEAAAMGHPISKEMKSPNPWAMLTSPRPRARTTSAASDGLYAMNRIKNATPPHNKIFLTIRVGLLPTAPTSATTPGRHVLVADCGLPRSEE